MVPSIEVDTILRTYETDEYEMVGCQMTLVDTNETFVAYVFKYVG